MSTAFKILRLTIFQNFENLKNLRPLYFYGADVFWNLKKGSKKKNCAYGWSSEVSDNRLGNNISLGL